MYTILLLLISLIAYADGETCTSDDFETFNNCSVNAVNNLKFSLGQDKDEIKTQIDKCLIDNECVDGDPSSSETNTIFKFFGKIDSTLFHQCENNVTQPLKQKIETCVQTKFKGFTIMHESEDGNATSDNDNGIKSFVDNLAKCKSEKIVNVMLCVKSAMTKTKRALQYFCSDMSSCEKKLPCKFNDVKATFCSCTRENLNSTTSAGYEFIADFFQCVGLKKPNLRRRLELSIFINKLINEFCDKDICGKFL